MTSGIPQKRRAIPTPKPIQYEDDETFETNQNDDQLKHFASITVSSIQEQKELRQQIETITREYDNELQRMSEENKQLTEMFFMHATQWIQNMDDKYVDTFTSLYKGVDNTFNQVKSYEQKFAQLGLLTSQLKEENQNLKQEISSLIEKSNQSNSEQIEELKISNHNLSIENENLKVELEQYKLKNSMESQQKIESLISENSRLINSISEINQKLIESENEKQKFSELYEQSIQLIKENEKNQDKSEIENELEEAKQRISFLESSNQQKSDESTKAIAELNMNIDNLKQENNIKQLQIEELKGLLNGHESTQNELDQQKQFYDELQKEFEEYKIKYSIQQELKSSENILTQKVQSLIEENSNIKLSNQQLNEKIDQIQSQLANTENEKQKLTDLYQEIQNSQQSVSQLYQKSLQTIEEKENIINGFDSKIKEIQSDYENQLIQSKGLIDELQKSFDEKSKESNKLEIQLKAQNDEFQKVQTELQSQIDNLQQENNVKQLETEELKSLLNDYQIIQNELQQKKIESENIKKQFDDYKLQYAIQQDSKQSENLLNQKVQSLISEKSSIQIDNQKLNEQINQLQSNLQQSEEEKENITNLYQQLLLTNHENDIKIKELENKSGKYSLIEKELDEAKRTIDSFEGKKEESAKTIEGLNSKIETLEQQSNVQQLQLEEMHGLLNDYQQFEAKYNQQKEEYQNLQNSVNEYKHQTQIESDEKVKKLENEIEEKSTTINELNLKLAQKESMDGFLDSIYGRQQTEEMEQIKLQLKDKENEVIGLTAKLQVKDEQIKQAKSEIDQLKNQINDNEEKSQELQKQLKSLDYQHSQSQAENAKSIQELNQTIQKKDALIENLENQASKDNQLISTLQSQMESITNQFKEASSQKSEISKSIGDYENKIEALTQHSLELEKEIDEKQTSLNSKDLLISSLESDNQDHLVKLEQLKTQSSEMQQIIANQKKELESIQNGFNIMKTQYDSQNSELTTKMNEMKSKLDSQTSENLDVKKLFNSLKSEYDTINKEKSDLGNQLNAMKSQYDAKIEEFNQTIKTLTESNQNLSNELKERPTEESFTLILNEHEKVVGEKEQTIRILESDLNQCRSELESSQMTANSYKKLHDEVQSKLKEMGKLNSEYRAKILKFEENGLNMKNFRKSSISVSPVKFTDQIDAQNLQLENENQELRTKLETATTELQKTSQQSQKVQNVYEKESKRLNSIILTSQYENQKLQNDLKEKDLLMTKFKANIDDLNSKLNDLHKTHNTSETQLIQIKHELNICKKQYDELTRNYTEFVQQLYSILTVNNENDVIVRVIQMTNTNRHLPEKNSDEYNQKLQLFSTKLLSSIDSLSSLYSDKINEINNGISRVNRKIQMIPEKKTKHIQSAFGVKPPQSERKPALQPITNSIVNTAATPNKHRRTYVPRKLPSNFSDYPADIRNLILS